MLVLAIPVLVGQHFAGGVRLVATQPKRKADVAKVLGHEVIERLDFLQVGFAAVDQFLRLGPDRGVGRGPLAFQPRIPAANLLPALKRGERSEERRVGKECRSRWWPYD